MMSGQNSVAGPEEALLAQTIDSLGQEEVKGHEKELAGVAVKPHVNRRLSRECLKESSDLRLLLEEEFMIKDNSGCLPKVSTHVRNINSWVYPAVKTFRTY